MAPCLSPPSTTFPSPSPSPPSLRFCPRSSLFKPRVPTLSPSAVSRALTNKEGGTHFSEKKKTKTLKKLPVIDEHPLALDGSGGGGGSGGEGKGGGGGGRGGGGGSGRSDNSKLDKGSGWLLSALMEGWRERVHADPQFPFKILTEEVVGVGASVVGDMASRPNFGLNELDFVFSTMVVCCIVNFALMYILAPTSAGSIAAATSLPGIFASCPPGHMFEHGAYSVLERAGTFAYKGAMFASVGFSAGLVGTAVSTLLLNIRRKLDPNFMLQNKPPPTLLNACTWALQLGLSSNSRYQALNGLEFGMERALNPAVFKGLVFALRSANNIVGGMSFVMMARLTGSQQQALEEEGKVKSSAEIESQQL